MTQHLIHFVFAANPLSSVFGPLVDGLRWLLRHLESFTGNWGVAIILLTVIVRLVIFPLTWKQFRSTQSMQMLSPKIKELQQKHKGDKQRLQQETMKLYQEHRVNPFGSCLPLLLQLPVFICLYYAIRNTPELQTAGFLWLHALGKPDPTYILLILYVASQLLSTELMISATTDKNQKWIMRAMPVVFLFILRRFPSGLFIYWVTTNLWTVGQQLIIRRTMKPLPATGPKSGKAGKPSRFIEAMTRAQEERERKLGAQGGGKAGAGGGRAGKTAAARPGGRPATKKRPGQGSGRPGARPQPQGESGQSGGGQRPSKPGGQRPNRPGGQRPNKPKRPGGRPTR